MRLAICLLALLLVACAHMNQPELAVGQAWRFRSAPNVEARVVVARMEPRGERRVVHASVTDLQMPPEAADLIARMEEFRTEVAPESVASEPPTQIILSGMFGADGDWYGGSLLLDKATGTASIPHVALYEEDFRAALVELTDTDRALPEHFAFEIQLWEQSEREWPSLHDSELTRPLGDTVRNALRSVPDHLQTLESDPPPAEQ